MNLHGELVSIEPLSVSHKMRIATTTRRPKDNTDPAIVAVCALLRTVRGWCCVLYYLLNFSAAFAVGVGLEKLLYLRCC
jgi:hypothetical protein